MDSETDPAAERVLGVEIGAAAAVRARLAAQEAADRKRHLARPKTLRRTAWTVTLTRGSGRR